jgi:multimeric flavodoxin WrbA
MKAIAVNGSPRKTWNTSTLLQKALDGAKSAGADTELIHLYDLNYKGYVSCFSCKLKNNSHIGQCGMKDDLTGVLERISDCDILLLGSPIYFSNVTGEMRSFTERLLFSKMTYNVGHGSIFKGKISSAFIYTMNVPDPFLQQYNYGEVFEGFKNLLRLLNGPSEYLLSTDTYQFKDYSKYEASMFDEAHKRQVKEEQFPVDCQKAYELGTRLASAG